MTPEQTSADRTPEDEPRPGRLTLAAALAGLEGLALFAGGGYVLVMSLVGDPDDVRQAVTTGIMLLVIAALPLFAARGLLGLRRWSRGPALITQILALPVAWNLVQTGGLLLAGGVVLAVVAVTALVLLVNPTTAQALGIRGPDGPDAA